MSKADLLSHPGDLVIEELDQRTLDALTSIVNNSALFNTFLHGDEWTSIDTDGGAIDSVAKIAKTLKAWRFVEVVKDADTRATMEAFTDHDIAVGQLVRVHSDPTEANNGIWVCLTADDTASTHEKVNYVDLISMAALPETQTDAIELKQSGAITGTLASPEDNYFAKVTIPATPTAKNVTVEVEYQFTSEEVGGTGSISGKVYFSFTGQDASTQYSGQGDIVTPIKLGDLSADAVALQIIYSYDAVEGEHNWGLRIQPPDARQAGSVVIRTKGRNDGTLSAMTFGDTL